MRARSSSIGLRPLPSLARREAGALKRVPGRIEAARAERRRQGPGPGEAAQSLALLRQATANLARKPADAVAPSDEAARLFAALGQTALQGQSVRVLAAARMSLDDSPEQRALMQQAIELAKKLSASVRMVHVLDMSWLPWPCTSMAVMYGFSMKAAPPRNSFSSL